MVRSKKPSFEGVDQSRKTLFLGFGELPPTSQMENLAASGIFLFYTFVHTKALLAKEWFVVINLTFRRNVIEVIIDDTKHRLSMSRLVYLLELFAVLFLFF